MDFGAAMDLSRSLRDYVEHHHKLRAAHIAVGVLCVLHKSANCSPDHLREKDTSALAAIQASATVKIVKVVASFLASIQKVESNALVKL